MYIILGWLNVVLNVVCSISILPSLDKQCFYKTLPSEMMTAKFEQKPNLFFLTTNRTNN